MDVLSDAQLRFLHTISDDGMVAHGRGEYQTAYSLEARGLIEVGSRAWNGAPVWRLTEAGVNIVRGRKAEGGSDG